MEVTGLKINGAYKSKYSEDIVNLSALLRQNTNVLLKPIHGCKNISLFKNMDEHYNPELKEGHFCISTTLFLLAYELIK